MCFWVVQLSLVCSTTKLLVFLSFYLCFRGLYLKPGGVLSLKLYLFIDHRMFSLALWGRNRERGGIVERMGESKQGRCSWQVELGSNLELGDGICWNSREMRP